MKRIVFLHSEIYVMILNDESFHFIHKTYISTIKLLDTCNNSLFYYITFIYFPYFNKYFAICKSKRFKYKLGAQVLRILQIKIENLFVTNAYYFIKFLYLSNKS